MRYRELGRTGLKVSAISLGTMTWGVQNTQEDAHRQMDYALDHGVNLWDTAEAYPVPPKDATFGVTESMIGSWLKSRGGRDRVIIATKVIGPDKRFTTIRGGDNRLDRRNIVAAIEASLMRLGVECIDLYQLHWPERSVNVFGRLSYVHAPDETWTPFEETLSVLAECVKAGKIAHVGISNETAWGAMRWLSLADQGLGPRMASIQNCYSLLNRSFDVGLAEVAVREQCGLLAYSPLAMGGLSGKYLNGARPDGARLSIFPFFTRYMSERALTAIGAYVGLARKAGLDPAQMALGYVISRPFVTSVIIGATNMEQLASDIGAIETVLSPDVLSEIEDIHKLHTIPCP